MTEEIFDVQYGRVENTDNSDNSMCIRTLEGGRKVNFQFPSQERYE